MSKKANKPWMKFYPSDWQSDERLRMCSLAARGLWAEMLCVMHKAEPYGHLIVKGEAPNTTQLAALTGTPSDSVPALIGELEKFEVFSRTAKGVIYSRRQVRDDKKQRTARNNGQNGGNPTLSKQKGKKPLVKGKDKDEVKAQRLEARDQKVIPPKNYIFEGKVIRLLSKDWDKWRNETELTDDELARFMDGRERFVSTLPEDDERRVDWFWPTYQDLKKKAEGIRMSRS